MAVVVTPSLLSKYILLGAYLKNRPKEALLRVQVGKIVERLVCIKSTGWNIFEK